MVLVSCASKKRLNQEVLTCFKTSMDNSHEFYSSEDFFRSVEDFERALIHVGLLKSVSKESYIEMMLSFHQRKNGFKKIFDELKNSEIDTYNTNLIPFRYKNCTYQTLKKNKNSRYLKLFIDEFDYFEASGLSDINSLIRMFEISEITNRETRGLICSLFYSLLASTFD